MQQLEVVPAEHNTCPRCPKNAGTAPHTCPYSVDINDDSETLCTCCDDCEHECAMDI